jgi:hypothetical protein
MSDGWPIDIVEAARLLHCGVRGLKDHCRAVGIGRRSGRTIIFSQSDFDALYRSLPCSGFTSDPETPSGISAEPSEAAVATKLRARKTALLQRRQGRSGKRSYLKKRSSESVVPFPSNGSR